MTVTLSDEQYKNLCTNFILEEMKMMRIKTASIEVEKVEVVV
ncbi:hypothetical protein [Staphylococcus aureus]|nr:hypothetical protein [Staphylococcus aureus]EZY84362.1 hypothetical protein V100_00523 [Staphylococcus aureus Rd.40]EZY88855.1 hypothetical protein V102_02146 [Staphylococcus aureus Rd.60]KAH60450.1 hypothetical protein W710_02701 [Staphylococcus aureus VET1855R]KAH63656.1 hypothetical protein W711_02666 [Staphylococcus aureus VET1856R]EZR30796.1 hypothetical protein V138_02829 [Staphylococcus aureus ZTA11/03130-3ST]